MIESFCKAIRTRLSDSFLGPLTFYFFTCNYKLMFYTFGDYKTDRKIKAISAHINPFLKDSLCDGLFLCFVVYVLPLVITYLIVVKWPKWSKDFLVDIKRIHVEKDVKLGSVDENGSILERTISELQEQNKKIGNAYDGLLLNDESLFGCYVQALFELAILFEKFPDALTQIDTSKLNTLFYEVPSTYNSNYNTSLMASIAIALAGIDVGENSELESLQRLMIEKYTDNQP